MASKVFGVKGLCCLSSSGNANSLDSIMTLVPKCFRTNEKKRNSKQHIRVCASTV